MRELLRNIRRLVAEVIAPKGFDVVSSRYTDEAEKLFEAADDLVIEIHNFKRTGDNEYAVHRRVCRLDSACVRYEAAADELL
jgi:predicted metal-dependent phosphoesterase TrpH